MPNDLFSKMTQSILTSADRPMADLMLEMASHLKEDDPERIFWTWMVNNRGRLKEACQELGVEPPEEGPKLFGRLKEIIIPKLKEITK